MPAQQSYTLPSCTKPQLMPKLIKEYYFPKAEKTIIIWGTTSYKLHWSAVYQESLFAFSLTNQH